MSSQDIKTIDGNFALLITKTNYAKFDYVGVTAGKNEAIFCYLLMTQF